MVVVGVGEQDHRRGGTQVLNLLDDALRVGAGVHQSDGALFTHDQIAVGAQRPNGQRIDAHSASLLFQLADSHPLGADLIGVEDDGHRAVVLDVDLHIRAKLPGGHLLDPEGDELMDKGSLTGGFPAAMKDGRFPFLQSA